MEKVKIVPAILVKSAGEFSAKIAQVAPFVSRVQIDVMDGKFVPNETLSPEEFPPIPRNLIVEYHLMVENPVDYIRRIGKRGAIYEMHIESFTKAGGKGGAGRNPDAKRELLSAISEVRKIGGKPALVLSPDTLPEEIGHYLSEIEQVLVMTVYPGFSGQKYIAAMEGKMKWLSKRGVVVEVDGGLDLGTAKSSARAGATLIGVASGIFAKPDVGKAIADLKHDAEEGRRTVQK